MTSGEKIALLELHGFTAYGSKPGIFAGVWDGKSKGAFYDEYWEVYIKALYWSTDGGIVPMDSLPLHEFTEQQILELISS
jgi:hypothetical protein